MIYSFANPTMPEVADHFVQYSSYLSDEEIDRVRQFGDELETTNVKLYGKFDESHVKATGSHFSLNDETRWLYDLMADVSRRINRESFGYDLTGFHENFYYLRYGADGDHFGWHVDASGLTPAPRKLSLVLQLSDPSEYEGGEFDVMTGHGHRRAFKGKGMVTAFPSYKIHRVTPVTSGMRRTLTMFLTGPNFR